MSALDGLDGIAFRNTRNLGLLHADGNLNGCLCALVMLCVLYAAAGVPVLGARMAEHATP